MFDDLERAESPAGSCPRCECNHVVVIREPYQPEGGQPGWQPGEPWMERRGRRRRSKAPAPGVARCSHCGLQINFWLKFLPADVKFLPADAIVEPPRIEHQSPAVDPPPELPPGCVRFSPIRCPHCGSKRTSVKSTKRPVRKHECGECGEWFKSIEDSNGDGDASAPAEAGTKDASAPADPEPPGRDLAADPFVPRV